MEFDPLTPAPQEYPKTVYVDAAKPAPQQKEGKVALTVNSPEEEARALKGEPLEAIKTDVIPEPTIQERQAYEKVVAYERQNLSPSQKARADKAAKAKPAAKAVKKASKPAKKAGKKKAAKR